MGDNTKISWTDATWNAIRGCQRMSKGCVNCYAERMASRFCDKGQPYHGIARRTENGPRWTGSLKIVDDKMDQPKRWRKPRMIFVNSMSDLFWNEVPDDVIKEHFYIMHEASHHIYQVLTKRPQRMRDFIYTHVRHTDELYSQGYEHVWLGTTVENQETADERIKYLQATPAAVRFLSVEPLLGPLDLRGQLDDIHWVIVGGESGPGARPMHPQWARDIRDTCISDNVAFFFKQWGAWSEVDWDRDNPVKCKNSERYLNLAGGHGFHGEDVIKIRRTSNHKTGSLLDGKEWKEMPAAAHASAS